MNKSKAIKILEVHNRWRRGDDSCEMQSPKEIGLAIDFAIRYMTKN